MAYCNKTTLPSCNRLLERKWDEKRLQAHHQKLRGIKSSVDNKPPHDFVHIRQNVRRAQILRDRQATIDQHNRQLLGRMNQILHTTGRVDHRNMEWQPKRSLNFVRKQHESELVMKANQTLLRRIQEVKPQYSAKTWESEFRHHKSLSKGLSILPPIPQHHTRRSQTLPTEMHITQTPHLPPLPAALPSVTKVRVSIVKDQQVQSAQNDSEIEEEIDVELPASVLKATS